jgi:hypothetical protein
MPPDGTPAGPSTKSFPHPLLQNADVFAESGNVAFSL